MADYTQYRSKGHHSYDPYRVASYGRSSLVSSSSYSRDLPGTYNLRSRELERADRQLQFRTYGRAYNAYPVHYEDTLKQFKRALHGNLEGFITETKEERQIGRDHARANKNFQRTKQEHEELKSGKRSEGENVLKSFEETRKKEKSRAQYESQSASYVSNVRAAIKEDKQYRENKRQVDQRKDKIRSETKEYEEQTQRIRQYQKEQREKLFSDDDKVTPPAKSTRKPAPEEDEYSHRRRALDVNVEVEDEEKERRAVNVHVHVDEKVEETSSLTPEGAEEYQHSGHSHHDEEGLPAALEDGSLQDPLETDQPTESHPTDLQGNHPEGLPEPSTVDDKEVHPTESKEEQEVAVAPTGHHEDEERVLPPSELPLTEQDEPVDQEPQAELNETPAELPLTGQDETIPLEGEAMPQDPPVEPTISIDIDLQLEQN